MLFTALIEPRVSNTVWSNLFHRMVSAPACERLLVFLSFWISSAWIISHYVYPVTQDTYLRFGVNAGMLLSRWNWTSWRLSCLDLVNVVELIFCHRVCFIERRLNLGAPHIFKQLISHKFALIPVCLQLEQMGKSFHACLPQIKLHLWGGVFATK